MATQRDGQRWILDALISVGGWDILHHEVGPFFQQLGYNPGDIQRVFGQVKSTAHIKMAFSTVAQEVEAKANYWLARGAKTTGASLLNRAMLLYGRAYYSYYGDDPRRKKFQASQKRCWEKLAPMLSHHVQRVELEMGGKGLYGIFESQKGATKQPCVILLPGMDMFKEDWHHFLSTAVIPRGWAGFALDGPGQGESLTYGLKVTIDNYEKAVAKVIDWLEKRPEVDPSRIVLMGTSFGSWWGSRTAAVERRLKAVATNMSNHGSKHIIFNVAQPNFKSNYMYMSGIADEKEFDKFAAAMDLSDVMPRITCPFLIVTGEYDELTALEDVFDMHKRIKSPREIWVYANEFHPMGSASAEWLLASLDWLEQAIAGQFQAGHQKGIYITRDGKYHEGTGEPLWWNPPG
jgi:pimeloyl-ACP methyl ester carboxylesterase